MITKDLRRMMVIAALLGMAFTTTGLHALLLLQPHLAAPRSCSWQARFRHSVSGDRPETAPAAHCAYFRRAALTESNASDASSTASGAGSA